MQQTAATLLDVVGKLAAELHPNRTMAAALDSSLDRDLGFDSLGRVELMLRIERAFDTRLPEQLLAEAETPRDLLRAVLAASTAPSHAAMEEIRAGALESVEAAPATARTLIEALAWHARAHPQRTHIHLYTEAEHSEDISYAALQQGARAVAAGLREEGLQPGEAVAIMLPTSRDFFYAFFGVLLAGGVPAPIYPPLRLSQLEDHLRRQRGILENALAAMLITVPEAEKVAQLMKSQVTTLRRIATVAVLSRDSVQPLPVRQADDVALMQYTSGSTGNPKGVVLTHANLLANIRAMGQAAQVSSADVFVSWLPLYHDMGLIGAWFGSLYYASPLVLMSPLAFLARPERWLWAIHQHRGTLSAAPNFAYELCLSKLDERHLQGLDLSSWRMAFNGAEPVSPETITRFSERFAQYGFSPQTMAPVYGLAESSVGLAFPPPGRGMLIDRIEREAFMRSGRAIPAAGNNPDALRFVACGQPLPGHQIRIVDATGQEVAERVEGRLEFKGPSATSGYFRNPGATRELIHGEWLNSGDFAYLAGADVYLTGRAKDIIIRAGRNLYPYELEQAAGNIPGIRKGCVAVFGSKDAASGTERLIVMAETRTKDPAEQERLRAAINDAAMDLLGAPPDDVVLVPPHTVLKTSSGKIRRAASREIYESKAIGTRPRAVWWQIARLTAQGAVPELRRVLRVAADVLYAMYVWILFGIMAPAAWLGVAVLPRRGWCQAYTRAAARWFIRLSGTPFAVQGLENLPRDKPVVLAANHASYLDGIVLFAALPRGYSYVAKSELTQRFISRVFLRRIGVAFVERFDFRRGVDDAAKLSQAMREGHSLVFFPEGTFDRMPGLLPFHMGAFAAAAENAVPLIPVAIRGTRSILRGDRWFPRRGSVTVTISAALVPQASGWDAMIKLRDQARQEILRHCGEPDLVFRSTLE